MDRLSYLAEERMISSRLNYFHKSGRLGYTEPFHYHGFYKICILLAGEADFFVED